MSKYVSPVFETVVLIPVLSKLYSKEYGTVPLDPVIRTGISGDFKQTIVSLLTLTFGKEFTFNNAEVDANEHTPKVVSVSIALYSVPDNPFELEISNLLVFVPLIIVLSTSETQFNPFFCCHW